MWWHSQVPPLARFAAAAALAALCAGCFQPVYGERPLASGQSLRTAMQSVDVQQIDAPRGSSQERIAVELRNALMFDIAGGAGSGVPTHRLAVKISPSRASVIVDRTSARTSTENYGIDATFTLVDMATGKAVVNGTTFARVSYDIPGTEQRFARQRALRDAEDRATKVIAEQIKNRLASYFIAGT